MLRISRSSSQRSPTIENEWNQFREIRFRVAKRVVHFRNLSLGHTSLEFASVSTLSKNTGRDVMMFELKSTGSSTPNQEKEQLQIPNIKILQTNARGQV